jgi:hypothetical protein
MAERGRKPDADPPLTLLALFQPPRLRREDAGREGERAYLEEGDPYRTPVHCQTVAADLSLHSSTFPPAEPPNLFYPTSLLAPRPPPPLPAYDFYPPGYPAEAGLAPPQPAQHFPDYHDYYDRLAPYTYDEAGPLAGLPGPQDRPQYDYGLKVEEAFPPFPGQPGAAALLPALHPSPAVLLHIKYVMETVF